MTAPSWSLGPHRPGKVPGPGPGYAGQDQKDWKLAMAMNTAVRAIENMEYVRRLLGQKQPRFAASLELAVTSALIPSPPMLLVRPFRRSGPTGFPRLQHPEHRAPG